MPKKDGLEGFDETVRNLNKEIAKINNVSINNLIKAGYYLEAKSVEQVPVDLSNLQNSISVTSNMSVINPQVVVGYSAKYAAAVHENPRAGKTEGYPPFKAKSTNIKMKPNNKGYKADSVNIGRGSRRKHWATKGKWKFLEDPFKENAMKLLHIIGFGR